MLPLVGREGLEQLRLHALVAVEDEDGKQAADVGADDLRAGEVVVLGLRLLADDHDVVPGPAPLARDRPRIDVRARATEQVSVPEDDSHRERRFHQNE